MTQPYDDVSELVTRVARHTAERDMEAEDWEKAVAINGLLATDREEFVAAAREFVDRSIETQTSAKKFRSWNRCVPVSTTHAVATSGKRSRMRTA